MAIQSLEQFRSTFSSQLVEIEIPEIRDFCIALGKELEGATKEDVAEIERAFGKNVISIFGRVAKEGNKIHLRPLTSKERDQYETSIVKVKREGKKVEQSLDFSNHRAKLVSVSWRYKDGKVVGSADEVGDLSAHILGHIYEEARKLNGMEDDEDGGEVGKK